MRVVAFDRFGEPEVLHVIEQPEPLAKDDEVVVSVAASTVNPTDVMMRAGKQAPLMSHVHPPYVAGVEFAGTVHRVGAGVVGLSRTQKVMGIVNARRSGGGSHAGLVCVPASSVTGLADSVELVGAATIPMNGLTAKIAVEALELLPGATVFITGGAGAAGGYAIQVAKHLGLTVIADAKERDVTLLKSLGADHIVPRGEGMVAAIRQNFPGGVDALIDAALIGNTAASVVRDGGVAVSLRRANPITDARIRPRYINAFEHATDVGALQWLGKLLERGELTPRVSMELPMDRAVDAHRILERGGLRGRVVMLFDH